MSLSSLLLLLSLSSFLLSCLSLLNSLFTYLLATTIMITVIFYIIIVDILSSGAQGLEQGGHRPQASCPRLLRKTCLKLAKLFAKSLIPCHSVITAGSNAGGGRRDEDLRRFGTGDKTHRHAASSLRWIADLWMPREQNPTAGGPRCQKLLLANLLLEVPHAWVRRLQGQVENLPKILDHLKESGC